MHEYAIAESLINSILSKASEQGATRIESVRFRRGSAFSEEAIHQAIELLAKGTPMEGAEILIETVNREYRCPDCGHFQVINSDDLAGHMFVCPGCGRVEEIEEAHDLEILGVTAS